MEKMASAAVVFSKVQFSKNETTKGESMMSKTPPLSLLAVFILLFETKRIEFSIISNTPPKRGEKLSSIVTLLRERLATSPTENDPPDIKLVELKTNESFIVIKAPE